MWHRLNCHFSIYIKLYIHVSTRDGRSDEYRCALRQTGSYQMLTLFPKLYFHLPWLIVEFQLTIYPLVNRILITLKSIAFIFIYLLLLLFFSLVDCWYRFVELFHLVSLSHSSILTSTSASHLHNYTAFEDFIYIFWSIANSASNKKCWKMSF